MVDQGTVFLDRKQVEAQVPGPPESFQDNLES